MGGDTAFPAIKEF